MRRVVLVSSLAASSGVSSTVALLTRRSTASHTACAKASLLGSIFSRCCSTVRNGSSLGVSHTCEQREKEGAGLGDGLTVVKRRDGEGDGKATLGKLSEGRGGAHTGFSERTYTVLNELN